MSTTLQAASYTVGNRRLAERTWNRIRTIPLSDLPAGEQEAFRSFCTRWQKQPDEFLVEAQEYDPPSAEPSHRRAVIVVHYPSVNKGFGLHDEDNVLWDDA